MRPHVLTSTFYTFSENPNNNNQNERASRAHLHSERTRGRCDTFMFFHAHISVSILCICSQCAHTYTLCSCPHVSVHSVYGHFVSSSATTTTTVVPNKFDSSTFLLCPQWLHISHPFTLVAVHRSSLSLVRSQSFHFTFTANGQHNIYIVCTRHQYDCTRIQRHET